MESNIIKRIEEIKLSTDSSILNRQKHTIPSYIDLYPEVIWDAFYIAGDRFTITGKFKFALRVHNLPYNEEVINKRENPYFISKLKGMVDRNEIRPILIFYRNILIPWSKIMVVHDITTSYILIADTEDWQGANTIKCVTFPFNISYIENVPNSETESLSFTETGLFDSQTKDIVIKPNDPCMFMYINTYTGNINDVSIPTITENHYTISKDNFLFVFKNGELVDDCDINISNSNTISINIDTTEPTDIIGFAFFCPANDDNININRHISKISMPTLKLDTPGKNDRIYNSLTFDFSPIASYEESLDKALDTIMKYDSDLMNTIYNDSSMVVSAEYTGSQFMKLAKQGVIIFNENHKMQLIEDREVLIRIHPLIFVNNLLYENIHIMQVINNQIRIPVNGIKPDDKIEILFFKEVINDTTSVHSGVTIGEDGIANDVTTEEVLSELYESYFEVYTSKPVEDAEVKMTSVDDMDRVQFRVNIKHVVNNDHKICFSIGDKYVGTVPLTLVSKRQFRHFGFYANRVGFNFQLTPDFNYCINKNQYLVFVNGRKINQDNFVLVSASPKQPFDDISIYMTFEFNIGDKVDVFYVPTACHEFATAPRIPMSGNICLDRTKFDYSFNTNFFLIFINGKKIYRSQIKNVDSARIHINTDIQTLNDICILKHMDPIPTLSERFKREESEWDTIVKSFDKETICKALGMEDINISDSEEDFNAWQITPNEINEEIARDYWLSSRIYNENTDVLYDYEDITLKGKDFYGAQITNLQNAMIEYERAHTEHNEDVSDENFSNTVTYH